MENTSFNSDLQKGTNSMLGVSKLLGDPDWKIAETNDIFNTNSIIIIEYILTINNSV